jgi:hypothetical protein
MPSSLTRSFGVGPHLQSLHQVTNANRPQQALRHEHQLRKTCACKVTGRNMHLHVHHRVRCLAPCLHIKRNPPRDAPRYRATTQIPWKSTAALLKVEPLGAFICGVDAHDRPTISRYFSHQILIQVVQYLVINATVRYLRRPNTYSEKETGNQTSPSSAPA